MRPFFKVPVFYSDIKIYNVFYVELYLSNYYTALQVRYHGEQKTMTTPWPMLLRDNSVTIHIRNLQLLMTEIYQTKWELNPTFMKEIFVEKHSTYGLRSCHNLLLPQARTTCYGLEMISFLGSRLWQALPNDMKQSYSLSTFKRRIKPGKEKDATVDCVDLSWLRLGY